MISHYPFIKLSARTFQRIYLVLWLTLFTFSVLVINVQKLAVKEQLSLSPERVRAGSYRHIDHKGESGAPRRGLYTSPAVDNSQGTLGNILPLVSPLDLHVTDIARASIQTQSTLRDTKSMFRKELSLRDHEDDANIFRDSLLGNRPGDDRILSQLLQVPASYQKLIGSAEIHLRRNKDIYVFNGLPVGVPSGTRKFENDGCPVTNCSLTDDPDTAASADAILFSGLMGHPVGRKPKYQLWIMFFIESPIHTQNLLAFRDLVNWTATYRRDSTLVTPYEKFVPHFNNFRLPPWLPFKNYAKGKTKKVAWFVSNCFTTNARLAYARELRRYIEVDIYGDCGDKRCPRSSADVCYDMLRSDYKFYLSFENSNCRNYITEKFFTNALKNDVIPVVMGAHPDDYRKVAPPNSFIHVDDFQSPRDLAKYLHKLDRNDTLYNEYFRWKGSGEFIDTKFWCRLCSMLHAPRDHVTWYSDIHKWWAGNDVCRKGSNDRIWPTWKGR